VSPVRTLTTEDDYLRLDQFLLAHNGAGKARQCTRHPAIAKMTYPQLAEAMRKELGFAPTRQAVAARCCELGIPRRHAPGPPPALPEERSQAATQRDQRYRDKLREDPVAWEAHLKRKRIVGKRVMERKRKDPKAWKAHLKRRGVYLRSWRRRQREAVAVA